MPKISRRQLSQYAAEALIDGDREVINRIAAYLVTERLERQADLLVKDIEKSLEDKGVLVAYIRTARELDEQQADEMKALLKKKYGIPDVVLNTTIEKDLLGGVVIRTASEELDGSLRRNINRLKAIKT